MPHNLDVTPTVELVTSMAERLREAAKRLDSVAESISKSGDFERAGEAAECLMNLLPNLRLDLLITRPVRAFNQRAREQERAESGF